MSRIVTVIGATGTQGGSVVDALLSDTTFVPRAITRDATTEAAQKLKVKGAQVVQADSSDTESLKDAITGSEAVFLVTAVFVSQSEFDQARRVVDASKAAGVKYIVFSSLPNLTQLTNGKIDKVSFFDNKTEIEDYVKASGIPYSILYTGAFLENAWKFGFLKPSAQHSEELDYTHIRFTLEHTQPFTWVSRDVGVSTLALLKNCHDPSKDVLGNSFYALTERIKIGEYIAILERVLEKKVNVVSVETTGMEAMDQLADYQREYGWYAGKPVPDPRLVELGAKFGTVEGFVKQNKEKLLATVGGPSPF